MMLRIQARAKINWTLDVRGKREDGYHELDMLMQSVTLADTLTIEEAPELTLEVGRGGRVPSDKGNLVLKAAQQLLVATGTRRGARLWLGKRIPVAAGMGGGSADAAAVLVGLNRLWRCGLTEAELECIGLGVGADVPFCVRGGLQRARGVGEKLTPLPCARQIWLVVIQPCRGLSTRDVFGRLHEQDSAQMRRPQTDRAQQALASGDLRMLCQSLGNTLQPVAQALRPEIGLAIEALRAQGAAAAQMTGSGSAVFGVFLNARTARAAWQKLRFTYRACYMTASADTGMEIQEIRP